MLRFISRLPGRTVRGILASVLVVCCLVVAATRTQVGRDTLARQIESEFASAFDGRLTIGRLSGNLLRRFTATDVRLVDQEGSVVLQVDTVLIQPSWEDLFLRRIVVPRIVIQQPRIVMDIHEDGRSGLQRALSRRTGPDSTRSPWSFRSARISVGSAHFVSRRRGDADSTRQSRPWDNLELTDLQLELLVDAAGDQVQFDVLSASGFDATHAMRVEELRGQLLSDVSGLTVNDGHLTFGASQVAFAGSWRPGGSGDWSFDADIDAETLDFDQLVRLLPDLPVRGRSSVRMNATGTPGSILVSRLDVATGMSSVSASGTVFMTGDSLDFDVGIERSRLSAQDLRRLLPYREDLLTLRFDSLTLAMNALGMLDRSQSTIHRLKAEGRFDLGGDVGSLAGVYDVDWEPELRTRVQLEANARRLNPSAVVAALPASSLTGSLVVDATGRSPFDLDGNASFRLQRSRIGNSLLERADLVAFAYGDDASASFSVVQPQGRMRADLAWRRAEPSSGFLKANWDRFDVGPFLATDSVRTVATGQIDIDFTGATEATLAGTMTLVVDSTRITSGSRTGRIVPQSLRATLVGADTPGPRLVLDGTALHAELTGDIRAGVLSTVIPFWTGAIANAVARETDKPYPLAPVQRSAALLENAREIRTSLQRADVAGATASLGRVSPFSIRLDLDIHDSTLLQGFPGAPEWAGNPALTAQLVADADSFDVRTEVRSDSILFGSWRFKDVHATSRASASFEGPAERDLVLAVSVSADTLTFSGVQLPDAGISMDYAAGRGTISLQTGRADDIGPLRMGADVVSLADRNRVTVHSLALDARNYTWALERPALIDFFRGGTRITELALSSNAPSGRQFITVRGAYSGVVGDSLFVDAGGVILEEVTRFASLKPEFGGILDARIAVTSGSGRPVLIGTVAARDFVMDRRLLGNVDFRSRLVPGRPDIALELDITPPDSSRMAGADPPDEIRRNELHAIGTIRPPDTRRGDPGAWDVTVDAPRVDLFFLKYIFTDSIDRVSGYLTGGGTVTGTWKRPVFNTEFSATDGRFRVPVTGGSYTLDGDVGIDRDAIRIRRVTIGDNGGGQTVAGGSLLFNDYRFFSFDLAATLDRFLIINTGYTDELPFYGVIRGSGSAVLTGPLANAKLRIADGETSDDSELFIPIVETAASTDDSFIVFADSTGQIPDIRQLSRRPFLLARRASVERRFLDGLDMELNLFAPRGSLVHLVIDPLLGDVINAESTGRVQIRRNQGEFEIFGQLEVEGGDYLFTAGEVFVRRFIIEQGGTITWESDPIDARLDIPAVYRTRASWAGLDASNTGSSALIPLIVQLQITGRVLAPAVDLKLAVDRTNQNVLGDYTALEARLNNPEKSAEYATSVLLTNSFQLTTESLDSRSGEQLAFNSVSQLVSAQLNRFLSAAIPNLDVNFGLQGERAQDLDITYGVALRLLDERLIIRGEGVYQGSRVDATNVAAETLQGEFVVEVRLSPTLSVEVFFRREGDVLQTSDLTSTTGAGLTYQTEFTTWNGFLRRLFGRGDRDASTEPLPPPETRNPDR